MKSFLKITIHHYSTTSKKSNRIVQDPAENLVKFIVHISIIIKNFLYSNISTIYDFKTDHVFPGFRRVTNYTKRRERPSGTCKSASKVRKNLLSGTGKHSTHLDGRKPSSLLMTG